MVNKVILLGNLGKDPETRFTPNGKAVTRFSLATSNTWVGANGEKQQATEWHTVVVWGKQGEACSQYLEKGRQVYVEGALRHRSYDNKDGKEQHVTEIVAQLRPGPMTIFRSSCGPKDSFPCRQKCDWASNSISPSRART